MGKGPSGRWTGWGASGRPLRSAGESDSCHWDVSDGRWTDTAGKPKKTRVGSGTLIGDTCPEGDTGGRARGQQGPPLVGRAPEWAPSTWEGALWRGTPGDRCDITEGVLMPGICSLSVSWGCRWLRGYYRANLPSALGFPEFRSSQPRAGPLETGASRGGMGWLT